MGAVINFKKTIDSTKENRIININLQLICYFAFYL